MNNAMYQMRIEDDLKDFFKSNSFELGEEFLARDCKGEFKSNGHRLLTLQQLGVVEHCGYKEEKIEITDYIKFNRRFHDEYVFVDAETKERIYSFNNVKVGQPVIKILNPDTPKRIVNSKLKIYRLTANTVDDIISVIQDTFAQKVVEELDKPALTENTETDYPYWYNPTTLRNYIK